MPSRSFRSWALPAVALAVVALAIGGALLATHHGTASAATSTALAANPQPDAATCARPDIVAAEANQLTLDPTTQAQNVTIPPGEPAVVAVVNGDRITAAALEARVSKILPNNARALRQLPPDAPASLKAQLQETPSQVRRETLDKMIDDALFSQEAQRLGLTASPAAAQAEAAHQLHTAQAIPATDPAAISFTAYLCVNHLTTATFASSPLVVRGYQSALSISAVKNHIRAQLPPAEQHNQADMDAAIAAYAAQLRQSGHVAVFLPD